MIPLFFFPSTALSPPACYPAHPPRAGSWMRDDACEKRNIHREHLDEKWRVWDGESSIGSTWREREREGDEERFHSLSLLALPLSRARSLARSLSRGKTDWSNTCTVAATAAERIASSSSRSNSSVGGAANSSKNSSLLHTHQNNHHHHHVRRRSCSRYQIPSHYPLLPRNVSVLDECSERSKATMAINATPLSLVLSLFVCLVFFFFLPPASPLLPLPPSFLASSSYLFSIFVVCEWMNDEAAKTGSFGSREFVLGRVSSLSVGGV
jgi:hypothetical protein